jgi:hypothetical protein
MRPLECPQPFCVLQRDGLGEEELSEILARMLAGEKVSELRPSPPSDARKVCVACINQIRSGKGPLPFGEEFEDIISGWRSYRRARRYRR